MFGFTFSYTPNLDNKCNRILMYNINTYINSYKLNFFKWLICVHWI